MRNIIRITVISIILVIILFGIADCSPSISQEEYDNVTKDLNDARLQVQALKDQLDAAMTGDGQSEEVNVQYQELKKQYDVQVVEMQTLKADLDELNASYEKLAQEDDAKNNEIQGLYADYDNLSQEFEELKTRYDTIVKGSTFTEEEVDQALFDLINQERSDNGLDKLEWGQNLYWWAKRNSLEMAEKGDFKYSSWQSQQAVLITAGQSTLDRLVNGTLMVWKQRNPEYSIKFINNSLHYGAVATYKSGDIYYITYMAATYP